MNSEDIKIGAKNDLKIVVLSQIDYKITVVVLIIFCIYKGSWIGYSDIIFGYLLLNTNRV